MYICYWERWADLYFCFLCKFLTLNVQLNFKFEDFIAGLYFFLFIPQMWHLSLQGCWKCQFGGRCISSFIFCSCDIFLEFASIFPRFNFPPTRAKSVFLALERRRRRRDKSNQLNRLLPRGEAGYESDFSLFTGCVAAPLDIYCNWVSYIVLQKISSVQVKDSFYFSLIHTEPDGLPLGGLQQVWRSKQLFS